MSAVTVTVTASYWLHIIYICEKSASSYEMSTFTT